MCSLYSTKRAYEGNTVTWVKIFCFVQQTEFGFQPDGTYFWVLDA